MGRRPKHSQRDSIGSPDSELHAKHVKFLGFLSIIYVHQSTLSRYQANQTLLKEELRLVESLLTPLHGVPSEILEEIFLFTVEGSEMERRKRSVERGDHPRAIAWPAPFALAAVCRYWRVLVCSNPRLWTYLVLDVRDKDPRIHERIRQHLKYSHNRPLDITIIAWGDYLRDTIVPMILPLFQEGSLARRLDTGASGLGRVELVTGGMNDREAGYTEILESLPPAQHLALVRVWPANTEIRVPASFCAQLRRIESFDGVFRLEQPCPSATEAALFRTDRQPMRNLLDRTPNLKRLTVDGLRFVDSRSDSHLSIGTMAMLHTVALRITDLNTNFRWALATRLPALRKLILINMPDTVMSGNWSEFIRTNGQYVNEVEVRAIVLQAGRNGQAPAYLAHLSKLPALTSLHLVGGSALSILAAMVGQPISRGMQGGPALSGVTRIRVSDCTLPRHPLQMCGWSTLHPSAPWFWRRGNARDIHMTLERVHVDDIYAHERSFTN